MDISSSGLHDRLGSFSKGDVFPKKDREEPPPSHSADGFDTQGVLLVQRCLIVRRDEKGYGLTVSGDNPVFVQSVKPGGAAARAGVHKGDRIIKVNGTLVTQYNHQDVVHLIKSGAHVALTLLGRPSGEWGSTGGANSQVSPPPPSNAPTHLPTQKLSGPSERITGPQPVDLEKQQQCTNISYLTIKKMLEQEQAYLEQMLLDYKETSSDKSKAEMHNAKKRIASLEKQLHCLKGAHNERMGTSQARRSAEGGVDLRSSSFHVSSGQPRAQPVHHQVSAPSLGRGHWCSAPRAPHIGSSTSLENLSRSPLNATMPWGTTPTHSRQRSSPDTLLYTMEALDCPPEEEPMMGPSLDLQLELPASPAQSPPPSRSKEVPHMELAEGHTAAESPGWTGEEDGEDANTSEEAAFLDLVDLEYPVLGPPSPNPMEGRPLPPIPGTQGNNALTASSQQYGTPPESQPPLMPQQARVPVQQSSIISMDDEERASDSEMTHLGDNGPFNNIWKLLRHPAHLSAFLRYLLSTQNDPSSLLFLIITNLYKLGTGKEMKKWAYEITSTFLVQSAPLSVDNIDDSVLKEIDQVLQSSQEHDDEDLKDVFLKAREKAMEQLKRLLVDFRNTRTIGLANMYMPSDVSLEECIRDKAAEQKLVESLLVGELESLVPKGEEVENLSDYKSALASALATVLKSFGVKSPTAVALIDKLPTFVAREKSRLKFFPRNRKLALQTIHTKGHHFQSQQYHCVTYCNHCQHIIWGVGDQGYQCTNCEMNIHKTCVKVVEEQCIGSLRHKKAKKNHRMSGLGLMENIKTKAKKPQGPHGERQRRAPEEWSLDSGISLQTEERCLTRPEDDLDQSMQLNPAERGLHSKKGASIGRSESFRQRRETRPSYRKRSDPNIPRSKSDVDVDDKPNNLNNSGSSSNSSLSTRSLESPSNSCEAVHSQRGQTPGSTDGAVGAPLGSATLGNLGPLDDSDLECDTEPPNWQDGVRREALKLIKPKEKKRQDVINELFHTERTHVRNLKILERLFHRPLQQEQLLGPELLGLLFPNLDELLSIHQSFNAEMKKRRRMEPLVGDIGHMMLAMLDGESGENLKRAVATFCKNQSLALETLKSRQKKDQKLSQFLADAELHPLCRRLQLKDMVATGFQRLTKYPLLLENVAKHSGVGSEEHALLCRALECSKGILAHVNQAVREAENQHRLADLQRRLDKTAFDKVEHAMAREFRNLDLREHRLVHEGPLVWRLPRQKNLEVQLVLLEDLLVLLQKQDDRLVLRFHAVQLPTARVELTHCPLLRLQHVFTRDVATDRKAFFLVSTADNTSMYEFAAASAAEKKNWLQHINEALKPHLDKQSSQDRLPSEQPERLGSAKDILEDTASTLEDTETCPVPELLPESEAGPEGGEEEEDEDPPAPPSCASPSGAASSPDEGPTRVEASQVSHGLSLVDFQEVVVRPSAPFETAQPVLTPIERLRRKDQEVLSALSEKQDLVAEILRIPKDDFENIAEISEEMNTEKGVMELLLQVTYHANQLPRLINEAMNMKEEDAVNATVVELVEEEPPAGSPSPQVMRRAMVRSPAVTTDKILAVATPLIRYLSQLAPCVAELEQERQQLRQELGRLRERLLPNAPLIPPHSNDDDHGRVVEAPMDVPCESSTISLAEASAQTSQEQLCCCPTTDLDEEDEKKEEGEEEPGEESPPREEDASTPTPGAIPVYF